MHHENGSTAPLSVSSQPSSIGTDNVIGQVADAHVERLRRALMELDVALPADVSEQLRAASRILDAIPRPSAHALVLHPLFGHWWIRLNGLRKRDDRNALVSWISHVGRFFLPFAMEHAIACAFPGVALADGELRFPALSAHIRLSGTTLAGRDQVTVCWNAGNIELRASGAGQAITLPDTAMRTPGTSPVVMPRAVIPGSTIELDASDPWIRSLLVRMNEEGPEPEYEERNLAPVTPVSAELLSLYRSTMELIAAAWPELRAEIDAHVRLIVPFTGNALGWANVTFNGAVFLNCRDASDLFFAVERLVHEASHVRLYTIMLLARIHETSHALKVASPFRRDQRPITGLYHALFVYARLMEFMLRAHALTGEYRYRERAELMRPKFWDGVQTIQEHAHLTLLGRDLLEQMKHRIAQLDW